MFLHQRIDKYPPSSPSKNFVTVLQTHAKHFAAKKACVFLPHGEGESHSLSFSELDTQARAVAALLQQHGLPKQPVLLLFPSGITFITAFVGCLYANVIAVPLIYPTQDNFANVQSLISTIIKNSQARAMITTTQALTLFNQHHFNAIENLILIDIENIPHTLATSYVLPDYHSQDITHLQYTSGSTSTPKGVINTHENLIHNLTHTAHTWHYTENSITLTWAPHTHVYGLMCGLLLPLYTATTAIIMPTVAFALKPQRWLKAISKYQVTHSGCPNFGYELCLRRIQPEEITDTHLETWKIAINGGEPVQKNTLEKFYEKFKSYGFRLESFCPAYGMSEVTGLIASKPVGNAPRFYPLAIANLKNNIAQLQEDSDSRVVVSCGPPLPGLNAIVVDPTTLEMLPPHHIGEIWLSGPTCSQGYWNTQDRTAFSEVLINGTLQNYCRTGDLGFLAEGEIFLTGRLKELIILCGKNYYPADLEATVANADPCLAEYSNVAFSIELVDQEQLFIIQEMSEDNHDYPKLINAIRRAISQIHGVDPHGIIFIPKGTIPKTSSGKIQRGLTREYFLASRIPILYQALKEHLHETI